MSRLTIWIKSFPVFQYATVLLHQMLNAIIRTGPIPKHIAFIMDGNRRFAKEQNLELHEGHYKGFETVVNVLEQCGRLGVRAVTIFAFSIENFNRSSREVDVLFDLIRNKIIPAMSDNTKSTNENGIRVNVIGNRSYLPSDIVEKIEELEERTKTYTRMILNVCFPYTAKDDITHAIQSLAIKVNEKQLESSAITLKKFEQELYTGKSPPLDILVRTGNVTRLSDFMLWECCQNCNIEFVRPLWPEFSVWDTYRIILKWSYRKTRELTQLEAAADLPMPSPPPAMSLPPEMSTVDITS